MINEIIKIIDFIMNAFLHIWPYLVITIPIAVFVQMSGASKYIKQAFQVRPVMAIFLATAVGAFSPFCSCGVIPIIAALLMGGVPLAPVMSFWVASPSMDPEIFFLSVGTIGWDLATWRLLATLMLSLSAGLITHFLVQKKWIGDNILRTSKAPLVKSTIMLMKNGLNRLKDQIKNPLAYAMSNLKRPTPVVCCGDSNAVLDHAVALNQPSGVLIEPRYNGDNVQTCGCGDNKPDFKTRLIKESYLATLMVVKFMALAFFLEALIILYVPSVWITGVLGHENPMSIITAAFLGVPVYTSNLSALPMVSGLLAQGMNPAAALAFLIAGPTTTLPAMAAVWKLVSKRVFILYVSFALVGAVVTGYVYQMVIRIM